MKNFKFNLFFVYLIILVLGITAMCRIVSLAVKKGKYYRGEIVEEKETVIDNRTFRIETNTISGKRGTIFSDDGTVLLSNVFIYDLYWYPSFINKKNDSLFRANADSLIRIFHRLNPKKSIASYNKLIKQSYQDYRTAYDKAWKQTKSKDSEVRKEGYKTIDKLRKQYVQIKVSNISNVSEWVRQKDVNEIDSLFASWSGNEQRFRGGCKKDRRNVRRQLTGGYPKSVLGFFESTVTRNRTDSIVFRQGIEGYYDTVLRGETITYRILKVNNETVRLKENRHLAPRNGCDVITTINNDIQRVTKEALEKQLMLSQAAWGCAIVMEVESGEIKAICNLDKKGGQYEEMIDHATSERHEPGSTFKLITLLVALEAGKIDTNTLLSCDRGTFSLKRAFANSDNKGLYNAAKLSYTNISGFLLALKKMSLDKNLEIETAQSQIPVLRPITQKEVDYQNVTHGYSIKIPPIYMLAYYNAIANDGIYIKPTLIKSISCSGKSADTSLLLRERIVNRRFCSPQTIAKAKACLEAVVTQGSGRRARDNQYLTNIKNNIEGVDYHPLIAGKTGTAFIYDTKEKRYSSTLKNSSFIGYFPSQKPKYTCLVLISGTDLDAGYVAVPVFKEIAEKLNMHDVEIKLSETETNTKKNIPVGLFGYANDLNTIYNGLEMPVKLIQKEQFVVGTKNTNNELAFRYVELQKQTFPELINATAKDAVYILEKMGYTVAVEGRGKVRQIEFNRDKVTLLME
ncbi:MAG: hypothetical protein LBQ64_05300 [Bacteroidales bacterium]|jgi:cell division protein FtsI (penicillin-binding protein 3)|nr:hypothetical protein [Bacteroidales bacterium]